jgi:hypothetical protein
MASAHDAAQCERVAIRAYLLGADDDCVLHREAAQRSARAAGDPTESARYAFLLGFRLAVARPDRPASGWLARADVLIAQAGSECPVSGYVLIPRVLAALDAGDVQHVLDLSVRAIGDR